MTIIDPTTTLGELVNAYPQLAREFELRGLDYCCGGGQSLADACAARGLDVRSTSNELADAVTDEPAPDWSTMGLADLVDHLEATHHSYLWDEMPRLSELVAKIVSVHGDRHPELAQVEACFWEVRHDLEPHLIKEERVRYSGLAELEGDTHLHIHTENNLLFPHVERIESELAASD